MYVTKNGFGGWTRLEKGFKEVLENDKTLSSTTKKIAGRLKTTYRGQDGNIVGTVTKAADGRTITKIASAEPGHLYSGPNGPAEQGLVAMGLSINPKNEAQKKLQDRIFRTANCNTTRTGKCVDIEVVKPNKESTQYFYHRGVAADGYRAYPENVLESPYDVSGQLTYLGGAPGYDSSYKLENIWLKNQDTGMTRTIKKPYEYIEWAND